MRKCSRTKGTPSWFRLVAGCAAALGLSAGAAGAQQLWNIEEVATQPVPPIVMNGVAVSAAAAGAPTAEAASVQVAFDYLRLGMGYLEFPLPDGSMIAAENVVFEDRGGGNLMWTGRVRGVWYESFVLTVQDGHLIGQFGLPGGPRYQILADPEGRGSLTVEQELAGNWCGVDGASQAQGGGRPLSEPVGAGISRRAPSASGTDSLDILVVYEDAAADYWEPIGGPGVAIQSAFDYLHMAFRNNDINATVRPIPVRWTPPMGSAKVDRHRYSNLSGWSHGISPLHDPKVDGLRVQHRADTYLYVPYPARKNSYAGIAGLYPYGWHGGNFGMEVQARYLAGGSVFAHELGHNLGSYHEAPYDSDCDQPRQLDPVYPSGLCGHTDFTASPIVVTIMSYGRGEPSGRRQGVPYYSSIARRPNGWTLGDPVLANNEDGFRDVTLPHVMSVGELARTYWQGPTDLAGAWVGRDRVRLTWTNRDGEQAPDVPISSGRAVFMALESGQWLFLSGGSSREDEQELAADWVSNDGVASGVELRGLRPGGEYRFFVKALGPMTASDILSLQPPFHSGAPTAPGRLGVQETREDGARISWADNSNNETGFELWYRNWSGDEGLPDRLDEAWRRYGARLPAGARSTEVSGLAAEEEIHVTEGYYDSEKRVWVGGARAMRGRYSFVVVAYNDRGWNASETFDLEFMPGPHPEPTATGDITNCASRVTGTDLDGYRVHACLETPDGARRRAWDYQLDADQSGLLYFFERDNAEILVKVLDGCAINGHRWVFIAPVTTLPFRLAIRESAPYIEGRRQEWHYDSKRRPQDSIRYERVGNPKDRTARTVSDTTAFPCTAAEIAAAKAASADGGRGAGFASVGAAPAAAVSGAARSLGAGARTDCVPGGPTLTLRGGYTVSMCYETYDGLVGDARDWGLDSTQSGLLYFFERNNAEVLIKVLDGCGVNGHRWVFVAPVTDLAFNLVVESPSGERWTHSNHLGQTADAASDAAAFPCASSA